MYYLRNLGSGLCLAPARSGLRPKFFVAWNSGPGTFANRSEQKRPALLARLGVSPGPGFLPGSSLRITPPPGPPPKSGGVLGRCAPWWRRVAFAGPGKKGREKRGACFFPARQKRRRGPGLGKGWAGEGVSFLTLRNKGCTLNRGG